MAIKTEWNDILHCFFTVFFLTVRKRKIVLMEKSVIIHVDGWVYDLKRLGGLCRDYQVTKSPRE